VHAETGCLNMQHTWWIPMHGNLIASFALILSSFAQRCVCFAKVYPFEQPPPYAWDNPSFQDCEAHACFATNGKCIVLSSMLRRITREKGLFIRA